MVNKTIELLGEFELICREWKELVRPYHNGGWRNFADGFVKVYFSDNSVHSQSEVEIGGVQIGFRSPPEYQFELSALKSLNETILKARHLLEHENEKKQKRENLLCQLEELDAVEAS